MSGYHVGALCLIVGGEKRKEHIGQTVILISSSSEMYSKAPDGHLWNIFGFFGWIVEGVGFEFKKDNGEPTKYCRYREIRLLPISGNPDAASQETKQNIEVTV